MLPLIVGLESTRLTEKERELFSRWQPAGYILFSRNIEQRDQCLELCLSLHDLPRESPHAPIIAIDQEGGRVVRTSALGLELPSAHDLGGLRDDALITEAAHVTALSLLALGVNTNFAPVLDLSSPQSKALPARCWGGDSDAVISYAGVWNREMQRLGMMSCGKHFPGLGEAALDPHVALPTLRGTRDDFLAVASVPFMALMPELPSLMIAHIALPDMDEQLPSSLSPVLVEDFLRSQLGYQGLIFTDDLCMGAITERYGLAEAAWLAIEAGCDLPLICHDVVGVLDAVGERLRGLSEERHACIARRVAEYCERMSSPPPYTDHLMWKQLLRRAHALHARCSGSSAEGTDSPVFSY